MEPNGIHYPDANGGRHSRSDSISSCLVSPSGTYSALISGTQGSTPLTRDPLGASEANPYQQNLGLLTSNTRDENPDNGMLTNGGAGVRTSSSSVSEAVGCKDSGPSQDGEGGTKSRNSTLSDSSQDEAE